MTDDLIEQVARWMCDQSPYSADDWRDYVEDAMSLLRAINLPALTAWREAVIDDFAPIWDDNILLAEHEAVRASVDVGGWLSAALDDPNVCDAMKADINRWFSAGFLYLDEVRRLLEAARTQGWNEAIEAAAGTRFYIDCEFDGHGGPLLSIALVKDDGRGIYISTTAEAQDAWVVANVVPLIDSHDCRMTVRCLPNEVGPVIRTFIDCDSPTIIADSPVDITRFCHAISTGSDGQWASTNYPMMRFEVHNIDCYPTTLAGAVQHNAWWDAMALREAIRALTKEDSDASSD